jgi:hypothetical protein
MRRLKVLALPVLMALVPLAAQAQPSQESPGCVAAGIYQVNDGAFEAAIATLDACIATLPPSDAQNLAKAYLHRGVALVGLRQEDAAKASFRKVVEYTPAFEPNPDAFSPQVIRVFKAARTGASRSVIDRPNTVVKKAGIGAGGMAAIAGGVAVVGGGSAAVIAAKPSATATATATTVETSAPTPTLTPTRAPAATTPPPATATATAACPTDFPPPVRISPSDGATVSGTTTLRCVPPADVPTYCFDGISYAALQGSSFIGDMYGFPATNYAVQWDTTKAANGTWNLECTLMATTPNRYLYIQTIQVTVNNAVATPTPSPTAVSTATATATATETATPGFRAKEAGAPNAGPSESEKSAVVWTSALSSTGAKGQVWLNGASALIQPSGQQTVTLGSEQATNTIEGALLEGQGAGAVWTFQLRSGFKPGSLKPQSGNADQVLPDTIVFRLGGRKGERVAFTFESR